MVAVTVSTIAVTEAAPKQENLGKVQTVVRAAQARVFRLSTKMNRRQRIATRAALLITGTGMMLAGGWQAVKGNSPTGVPMATGGLQVFLAGTANRGSLPDALARVVVTLPLAGVIGAGFELVESGHAVIGTAVAGTSMAGVLLTSAGTINAAQE